MESGEIEVRRLSQEDVALVGQIDRSEQIGLLYEQRGTELLAREGTWDSPVWDPDGDGEHSVAAQVRAVRDYIGTGGVALGAFVGGRLVGIGVVVSSFRPGTAQLAYLHVSAPARASGIGSRLCRELEEVARAAGARRMVVSATPTGNTVRFYSGRGYRPMAEPFPELFDLEPEDIHMSKLIQPEDPEGHRRVG